MTKELVVECSCSKRGSQRAQDEILDRIASSNESTTGKNNMNTAKDPRPSFEHATADCSSPCPLFPLSHGARVQNGRRHYYPPSLQSPDILSNFYRTQQEIVGTLYVRLSYFPQQQRGFLPSG